MSSPSVSKQLLVIEKIFKSSIKFHCFLATSVGIFLLFLIYPFEKICQEKANFYSFIFQKSTMDTLNLRLAEEKNFHSEILLFSFNPEHDIIVVCSANGDVYLNFIFIFF